MIRLYSAYALFDDGIPFKFEVREIPVKSISEDGTIETDWPCFYGAMDYTNYINGKSKIKTETEYASGDSFVYYSESYEKCVKLLVEKREKLFQEHERMLEVADRLHRKLMDSEIRKNIKVGSSGKKKYSLWSEGYSATGEHQTATYLGELRAILSMMLATTGQKRSVSQNIIRPEQISPDLVIGFAGFLTTKRTQENLSDDIARKVLRGGFRHEQTRAKKTENISQAQNVHTN